MAKRILCLFMILTALVLAACSGRTYSVILTTTLGETASPCRDTPLAEGCYEPSGELDFISVDPDEFTIDERFDADRLAQLPPNWLLYTNAEYAPNGVFARVVAGESGRYVEMYSDGLQKPPYPQSAPTPSFIFTTKFNLDVARAGVAYADVMLPETGKNAVGVGIATGAVNAISITIDNDLSLFVKVGGPFYYYSQNGDGGDYHETGVVIETGRWYTFMFTWDAAADELAAYLMEGETATELWRGAFHISNRFNASADGALLVPNVFKVNMPYGQAGTAYLDNVIVTRKEE